jgi:hypothetical protein
MNASKASRHLHGDSRQGCGAAIALLCLSAVADPARAVEIGLAADLGAGHTTNIEHSDHDTSATYGLLRLAAGLEAATRTFSADVAVSGTSYQFRGSEYRGYERVAGWGEIEWSPIPERFSWTVSATSGQVATDPSDSISYRAAGNGAVFSTGPVLRQPLPGSNELILRGEVTRSDFGHGYDLTSTTQRSELEFRHAATPLRSFSVGARYRDSSEELADQRSNFYVATGYVAFRSIARRSAIDIEVSADRLSSGGEASRSAGYSITLERFLGKRLRVFGSTERGWRDSADLFSATIDQAAETEDTRFLPASGELFRYRQVRLGIMREGSRMTLNLVGSRGAEQGRVRKEAALTALFPLAARNDLALTVYGSRQREQGSSTRESADNWAATARYTWLLGRQLSLIGAATYVSGDLESAGKFREKRYALTLRYSFSEAGTSRPVGFDRKYEQSLEEARREARRN